MIDVKIATTGAVTIVLDSDSAIRLTKSLGETWAGEGFDELYDALIAAMGKFSDDGG
jgi:hypothetical protein